MKNTIMPLLAVVLYLFPVGGEAQNPSSIKEIVRTMNTYPFSDPDPVPMPENLYYPYFRFDGYTDKSIMKDWKVVEMENDYIKLTLFPEIGGKIWGAVEKTTNKEFIYSNHVVKFRDIAMRGAWTSGGIEFNYGIIGHAPTTSSPVDYQLRTNEDGSVSCFISSIELITRTSWSVEVNLPKDKAYFTTRMIWYNGSSIDQPYYQWTNAGFKASGNLEFCYPGQYYIGHGGDVHSFPKDESARDISWYEKNNFGGAKSYHVLGKYNDFYGAYWHDDNFGSVHYAPYDDKNVTYKEFANYLEPLLKFLADNGKALEINTKSYEAGVSHGVGTAKALKFDLNILRRFRDFGGEAVSLGSDAHDPDRVGNNFKTYWQMVQHCGFKYLCYFERRKPVFYRPE